MGAALPRLLPGAHRGPAAHPGLQRAGRPACFNLAGRLGAPRSLSDLGMAASDSPRIADLAVASPYANPRPLTREGVEALLRAAWAGEAPVGGSAADERTS
ncbi:hypothetical protein [Streptomyces sasae]